MPPWGLHERNISTETLVRNPLDQCKGYLDFMLLRFQLVWAELQGSEVNPSSLGTGDPHDPARFLARVSSARGGRDSALLLAQEETPAEGDSSLTGFRAKVKSCGPPTPVLPQEHPQS